MKGVGPWVRTHRRTPTSKRRDVMVRGHRPGAARLDSSVVTPAGAMRQAQGVLSVGTRGRGFTDLTRPMADWLSGIGAETGLLTVFVRHTSASLTIQENADPDVLADLDAALDHLAPESTVYRHRSEGPDDMPAHIKAALTATTLSIPVAAGRPVLGTWQAVYLIEHRALPHQRDVVLHYVGTLAQDRPA